MAPLAAETREMLLALEPRPESARLARRALHAHGLHEDIEHTVTLLATEVVGNAVRHADLRPDQRIVFFARLHDSFARIEVADPGLGFDPATSSERKLQTHDRILDTAAGVLRALDRIGYDGWLMVEQDSSWLPPAEAAMVGRRVVEFARRSVLAERVG